MTAAAWSAVLLGVTIAVAFPIAVLLVECLAALWPPRRAETPASAASRRIAVLIPAHNEEASIAETVRAIRSQVLPEDAVVVVADNCTDATAERARGAGAEVLERRDAERRGKGYALAFGLRHVSSRPPEIVVFVDADTRVEPGAIAALRGCAGETGRPAQAVNLLAAPPDAGPTALISSFAFLVKNLVRPAGLARLGVPCLLLGTGMAIPWKLIDIDRLATGNIVEDMQLGIDLAIAGTPPVLCLDARVTGSLPSAGKAALVQRTRWEHGHLGTLMTQSPRLLWHGLTRARPRLLGMAIDLGVPPLALLCLIWAFAAAAAGLAAWRGWGSAPAIVSEASGGALLLSVFLAWVRHARRHIPGTVLALAPLYVLWKIPVYLAFLFRRQKSWVRTPRDVPQSPQ